MAVAPVFAMEHPAGGPGRKLRANEEGTGISGTKIAETVC